MCGGTGDNDKEKIFLRKWKKDEYFLRADSEAEYRKKRAAMLSIFTHNIGSEDIYTYAMIFHGLATDFGECLNELGAKKAYFTSFMHYLEEFEKINYPYLVERINKELNSLEQAKKETVRDYHARAKELLSFTKRKEDDFAIEWVRGLRFAPYKTAISAKLGGHLTLQDAYCLVFMLSCQSY